MGHDYRHPKPGPRVRVPGDPVPVGTELRLRVLKSILPHGQTEILAPNPSEEALPSSMAGAVHDSRSGIEVHFDVLKNRLEISNFAGILPPAIPQEHQATVLLGNPYRLAEAEAQPLWDAQQAEHPEDYQYEQYKINTRVNIQVGVVVSERHPLFRLIAPFE